MKYIGQKKKSFRAPSGLVQSEVSHGSQTQVFGLQKYNLYNCCCKGTIRWSSWILLAKRFCLGKLLLDHCHDSHFAGG